MNPPPTEISDGTMNSMAYSLLPTINLLLAAHDLDALLDSVGAEIADTDDARDGKQVLIRTFTGTDRANDEHYTEHHAFGPTRMAAIRNAVAQAQGRGERDV